MGALCGGVGDGGRAMPAEGRKPFLGRVAACHSPGWPGGRGWWRWALGRKFFWFFLFTKRTGLAWLFWGWGLGVGFLDCHGAKGRLAMTGWGGARGVWIAAAPGGVSQ